jgi:hypothetical protein
MNMRRPIVIGLILLCFVLASLTVFAQIRPKDYPPATNLLGTDILVVTQNPGATNEITRKATMTQIGQTIGSVSQSNGFTLYVSPTGSDATAQRGNPDRPWGTISNACWAAQPGDTILVGEGLHMLGVSRIYGAQGESAILLSNKSDLRLIGQPGNIVSNGLAGSGITIDRCRRITIENLNLYGYCELNETKTTNISLYGIYATVEIVNSSNVTVRGNRIIGATDHAIVDGPAARAVWPNWGMTIEENYIENTGHWSMNTVGYAYDGSGIAPGGSHCIVARNTIVGCRQNGIEIYPTPTGVSVTNITITDNIILNCLGGVATSYAFGIIYNLKIIRNHVHYDVGYLVDGSNSVSHTWIQGMGIGLPQCIDAIVEGNHVWGMSEGLASKTTGILRNVLVQGNTFRSCSGAAFYNDSLGWRYSHVKNNLFANFGQHGIMPGLFRDGTISDNVVMNVRTNSSSGRAIWLNNASNVLVSGNILMDTQAAPTTSDGVYFDAGQYSKSWNNRTFAIANPATGVDFAQVEFIPGGISLTATNGTPTHTAPNGSLCLATSGALYQRTNNAWLLK